MPSLSKSTLSDLPEINLNSDAEHVRRELYDCVVLMQFSPLPPEEIAPGDYTGPDYDPDDAGLKVYHLLGRWFATWHAMDQPGKPERLTTPLFRVAADPSSPFRIALHEV